MIEKILHIKEIYHYAVIPSQIQSTTKDDRETTTTTTITIITVSREQ
jgi:hypothetical protein